MASVLFRLGTSASTLARDRASCSALRLRGISQRVWRDLHDDAPSRRYLQHYRLRGRTLGPGLPKRYSSSSSMVDGMPRFPNWSAGGLLRGLDYGGTIVFAFSGTVQAAAHGMDLLGCSVVGAITAVGGGTVRDLFLGNRPVFWMVETEYLILCLITSGLTLALWPVLTRDSNSSSTFKKVELYSDAAGLSAFCVIGAQNGIRLGVPPIISVVCGMMTATFGGVIRDVLCQRPARILHSHAEVYASCAAVGAASYVLAARMMMAMPARIGVGVGAALTARIAAFTYDIRLPTMTSVN